MPRHRTIKPGFWSSEQVAALSPLARLTFIGLWNFADDYGRDTFSPGRVKMQVFAGDTFPREDVEAWMTEIANQDLIRLYEVDGKRYFWITGWSKHQKVDHPSKSDIPPPPDLARKTLARPRAGEKERERERERETTTADAVRVAENSKPENQGPETVNGEPFDEPTLELEEPAPATIADAESARADRFDRMFDDLWEIYTSFGSPNSSRSNARRRFVALSAEDRGDCYAGLLRYRDRTIADRRKRPDLPVKHLETFIDARSWESYPPPDLDDEQLIAELRRLQRQDERR